MPFLNVKDKLKAHSNAGLLLGSECVASSISRELGKVASYGFFILVRPRGSVEHVIH